MVNVQSNTNRQFLLCNHSSAIPSLDLAATMKNYIRSKTHIWPHGLNSYLVKVNVIVNVIIEAIPSIIRTKSVSGGTKPFLLKNFR